MILPPRRVQELGVDGICNKPKLYKGRRHSRLLEHIKTRTNHYPAVLQSRRIVQLSKNILGKVFGVTVTAVDKSLTAGSRRNIGRIRVQADKVVRSP